MVDEELTWLDAVGQADLVRRREVTAEELLDAALRRIDALNPRLNAVIHRLDDSARRAAAAPTPSARRVSTPTRSRPGSAPTSSDHGRRGGGAVYGSPGPGPARASRKAAVSRTVRVSTC